MLRYLVPFLISLLCLPVYAQNTVPVSNQNTDDAILLNLEETVVKVPINRDINLDDAVESMKLKANELNMKYVGFQPLWKELQSLGEKDVRRIEIYQFCDARIAHKMLKYDINYGAYMPCRITLIEDETGQGWLVTANLSVFISAANLPDDLQKVAEQVRDNIEAIMEAGATGDL